MRRPLIAAIALALAAGPVAAFAQEVAAPPVANATTQLPRGVVPSHYAIEVTPHADKLAFDGKARIDLNVAEATDRIVLQAIDMSFANSRLVAMDRHGVTFRWKDYRARSSGKAWQKTMTLTAPEFIRRFLLHVLPDGFHRIRHYGLLASSRRADTIVRIRQIIAAATQATTTADREPAISAERSDPVDERRPPCPCCGGRMILVERFAPGTAPRTIVAVRIDTS